MWSSVSASRQLRRGRSVLWCLMLLKALLFNVTHADYDRFDALSQECANFHLLIVVSTGARAYLVHLARGQ